MASGNTNFGNDAGTGTVGADGFNGPMNATGLTWTPQLAAAAGSNSQANSTLITAPVIIVTGVSATTRGVKLPVAVTGKQVIVINGVTTNMKVYPNVNAKIGTTATNTVTSLAANASRIYVAQNTTQWRVASNT